MSVPMALSPGVVRVTVTCHPSGTGCKAGERWECRPKLITMIERCVLSITMIKSCNLVRRLDRARVQLVIEAPEEIERRSTLIAATTAHFQMTINAVFNAQGHVTGRLAVHRSVRTAILTELQGHKDILRHIAPELDAPGA